MTVWYAGWDITVKELCRRLVLFTKKEMEDFIKFRAL
jgi:hypothetical protein